MYLVFIYYAYVYNVLHFILNKSINQSETLHVGFRALPSLPSCASDVNRLRHWCMHVRTSHVCPMVFDVSSTSRIAYVTIIIVSKDSANPCLFQQCANDVNDLAYVIGA